MSRFEIKIVAALLLIAVIPLAASVLLVGQVIKVSNRVAEGQTQRLSQPLDRAADAYRSFFAARKQVFKLQGDLLAQDPALRRALSPLRRKALEERLNHLLKRSQDVGQLEVVSRQGESLGRAQEPIRFSGAFYRDLRLMFSLGQNGHKLRVIVFTPRAPFDDFRSLGQVQGTASHMKKLRDKLALYYRVAFLIMFGAVLLVATGLGIFIARRTTRRVAVLAAATRKVARGDLETRVHQDTRDELGDLAYAFNEMVSQMQESRERIAYLEKIGAWQEIARHLAHEIKNPLTPIQLAAQQLQSKYQGNDPEFSRLLMEAKEIITEEVEGLRRLVQDFSAFARLPSVQPEPVDINNLIDDFLKSHSEIEQKARIAWQPVTPTCQVLLDRMLIKHVLYNLMENAIQAAEEAGLQAGLHIGLSLEIDQARHRVELTVADNGPGMDAATAQRVFDPYFTTKEKGTGLGLAIVKKIVLEHHGTISVRSLEAEGTRFILTLPLVDKQGV